MAHDSNLKKFYANTNVLITGGAGFLGKMLIQKLLRTYDDIDCIYLIIRSKKGKSPADRMREVYENPVFDLLRQQKPNFESKICVLEGDASLPMFGLSEIDKRTLVENVDIVFHCAAYLNMTGELKQPVETNVKGFCELLDVCKDMMKLKSFVMVSTAYSNAGQAVIEEKFYKSNVGFETIIKLVDELDQATLQKLTPVLIGDHPNAYTYSKNIAEQALLIKGKNMPISLFRPSIVIPSYSDPCRGWTDNIYGPTGIMLTYGIGLNRAFLMDGDKKCDFVPIDYCVNALICSAWDATNRRLTTPSEIPVYNYSAGEKYSRTWDYMIESGHKLIYNFDRAVWKRIRITTAYKYYFYLLHFLLHLLPAYFVDAALLALGRKPSMIKIYNKISKFMDVLSFFAFHEWDIKHDNVYAMWKKLSENEKITHPFDMGSIDYDKLAGTFAIAIKLYIFKEKLENIEGANKRYQRLQVAHYSLLTIFCLFWIWIAFTFLNKMQLML